MIPFSRLVWRPRQRCESAEDVVVQLAGRQRQVDPPCFGGRAVAPCVGMRAWRGWTRLDEHYVPTPYADIAPNVSCKL